MYKDPFYWRKKTDHNHWYKLEHIFISSIYPEHGKKSRWSREDSIKRENKSPSPVEIVFEKPRVVEAVFGKPPPKNSQSICPR